MNVNSVASVLAHQAVYGLMEEFTLVKNRMNVNSVASALVKQER